MNLLFLAMSGKWALTLEGATMGRRLRAFLKKKRRQNSPFWDGTDQLLNHSI